LVYVKFSLFFVATVKNWSGIMPEFYSSNFLADSSKNPSFLLGKTGFKHDLQGAQRLSSQVAMVAGCK
jgi:hypothetical protein